MIIKKLAILFGITAISLSALAQGEVVVYSPGVTSDGVTYYLPKTCFQVTLNVKKTTFTPGEFCKYAERYLRLDDVSSTPEEYWEITGADISSYSIPDVKCLFTIKFNPKVQQPSIELNEDGIIQAINTKKGIIEEDQVETRAKEQTEKLNPKDYLTEDILLASSTAKMAELTATEIYNIRESKNAITRGQAESMPKDGESLKYILELLDKQEKALLLLFEGQTVTEERTYTINVESPQAGKQILARFSRKLGLLAPDNLAGAPVNIEIEDLHYLPQSTALTEVKTKKQTNTAHYLYYRVPGRAVIRISDNKNSYMTKTMPVAQFGNTEVLSTTLFAKGARTKVLFDTNTGNILSIGE